MSFEHPLLEDKKSQYTVSVQIFKTNLTTKNYKQKKITSYEETCKNYNRNLKLYNNDNNSSKNSKFTHHLKNKLEEITVEKGQIKSFDHQEYKIQDRIYIYT
jgi:hypothetical protein